MRLTDVIRRPLVTEKTSILKEQDGQSIVFRVAIDATKIEIKQAIEALLGAKVATVRTASMHGKVKRQGRFSGKRSDWKKAYVRLQDGQKVPEFLEGALSPPEGNASTRPGSTFSCPFAQSSPPRPAGASRRCRRPTTSPRRSRSRR